MTGERSVIGLYCVIFVLYWRIKLKRAYRLKGVLYAIRVTVNFILCTAFFILILIRTHFAITVSHIYMSGVQLIFEFSGSGAGHRYIGFRSALVNYRS